MFGDNWKTPKELRDEYFRVQVKVAANEKSKPLETVRPPLYYHMPRQFQADNSVGDRTKYLDSELHGFFGIDHPNTIWLINLLKDTSEWRLHKVLVSLRTRPLFESKKYYQIIDRPTQYWGSSAKLEKPLFGQQAMLYLNPFGIALYLKAQISAENMVKASTGRSPLVNPNATQYAAYVHDKESDLVLYYLDYLCIKREYYSGLYYLARVGWNPVSTTTLTYRRKYYQFSIPFPDWMDVFRYTLSKNPAMNAGYMVEEMFRLQFAVHGSHNFSMMTLKPLGKLMIEAFQLWELKESANEVSSAYVGMRILKNKRPILSDQYSNSIYNPSNKPLSPNRSVVVNNISFARRMLTYEYYFDSPNMYALPQVIRAVRCFREHGFFLASEMLKFSSVSDQSGKHYVFLDPLIFQVRYFLDFLETDLPLRHKEWPSHYPSEAEFTEREIAWSRHFDTINCVSLLTGLLQNSLIRNLSKDIIDRLCELIVDVLVDSQLIEAFLRYSSYDVFFGLTGTINCVPNLMSKTVLRFLNSAPILLANNYEPSTLSRMFSKDFWELEKNDTEEMMWEKQELSEFLVSKRRRSSMQVEGQATSESMSGASSMGSAGSTMKFIRKYSEMAEIDPSQEVAEQQHHSETLRKQDEERQHVKEYRRLETNVRYKLVYDSYAKAFTLWDDALDEEKTLDECRAQFMAQHKIINVLSNIKK